jgi:acetyl esterase/lipase
MLNRIGPIAAACWLVAVNPGLRANEPQDRGITVLRDLRYREGPGRHGTLDLAMKADLGGKPRPAIVVIHGGGWLEGDKSSFSTSAHRAPGNIIDFAALGFVAVTINYRLSAEAPYPAALEDCRLAVRWLRAHAREYHVDADRIGAYGNSAGGHLALLLGMTGERADRVQAAVSDSGPIDLIDQDRQNRLREVVRRFLGGPPEGERAVLYKQASPINQIGRDTPPLLLIYGVADEQVPVATADRFVSELGRAGLEDVSYYRLAFVDHCPHSLVRVPFLQPVVDEFFVRTLLHPETARRVKRR